MVIFTRRGAVHRVRQLADSLQTLNLRASKEVERKDYSAYDITCREIDKISAEFRKIREKYPKLWEKGFDPDRS